MQRSMTERGRGEEGERLRLESRNDRDHIKDGVTDAEGALLQTPSAMTACRLFDVR